MYSPYSTYMIHAYTLDTTEPATTTQNPKGNTNYIALQQNKMKYTKTETYLTMKCRAESSSCMNNVEW